jgi:hypothetical protein
MQAVVSLTAGINTASDKTLSIMSQILIGLCLQQYPLLLTLS